MYNKIFGALLFLFFVQVSVSAKQKGDSNAKTTDPIMMKIDILENFLKNPSLGPTVLLKWFPRTVNEFQKICIEWSSPISSCGRLFIHLEGMIESGQYAGEIQEILTPLTTEVKWNVDGPSHLSSAWLLFCERSPEHFAKGLENLKSSMLQEKSLKFMLGTVEEKPIPMYYQPCIKALEKHGRYKWANRIKQLLKK